MPHAAANVRHSAPLKLRPVEALRSQEGVEGERCAWGRAQVWELEGWTLTRRRHMVRGRGSLLGAQEMPPPAVRAPPPTSRLASMSMAVNATMALSKPSLRVSFSGLASLQGGEGGPKGERQRVAWAGTCGWQAVALVLAVVLQCLDATLSTKRTSHPRPVRSPVPEVEAAKGGAEGGVLLAGQQGLVQLQAAAWAAQQQNTATHSSQVLRGNQSQAPNCSSHTDDAIAPPLQSPPPRPRAHVGEGAVALVAQVLQHAGHGGGVVRQQQLGGSIVGKHPWKGK